MVMLSSVAKAPPTRTQGVVHVAPASTPKEAPLRSSLQVHAPPPLAAKQNSVEGKLLPPGGHVETKLPPPMTTSREPSSSGSPTGTTPDSNQENPPTPAAAESPSPENSAKPLPALPAKAPALENSDSRKTTVRLLIPSIKLNQPAPEPEPEDETPRESIILGPGEKEEEFPTRVRPPKIVEKPATTLEPVLESKPSGEISVPPFTPLSAPAVVILPPVGPAAEAPAGLQPLVVLSEPATAPEARTPARPPPLPAPKLIEKLTVPGVHVVPKMVGNEPVAHVEKLRPQPQLPVEGGRSGESALSHPVDLHDPATVLRAPALIPVESKTGITPPPALPSKAGTDSKVSGPISVPEKAAPSIVTSKVTPTPIGTPSTKTEENRPALRPAVLPNKSLNNPKTVEAGMAAPVEKTSAVLLPDVTGKPPETGKLHAPVDLSAKSAEKPPAVPVDKKALLPQTRAERAKKRRLVEMVVFYVLLLCVGVGLYFGTLYFSRETRVEGQVIPPNGMPLADEVWIVSDFRQLTTGIAEDVAQERAPLLQEMHERQDHVQRVQADIATREERIRLLQAQIQSAKDEEVNVVKQARDAAQQLWDGPGAQMDEEYNARQNELQNTIANRAKSLNLKYAPDPTYSAPEVWANAYRLALYEVPKGVDSPKEYDWLNNQMKAWRDFVKTQDDQREQLREKAAQIKLEPASKLADLNAKIEELNHRIESTQSEEDPLKPELQQAQADLAESQTTEMGLDAKYYKQLSALPSASITKRLPMDPYGRFTWGDVENDSPFAEGENEHHYWIFSRATRADGREYWALGRFSITKDHTIGLLIEPDSFVSTKAMLRPELSPDEQAQ